MAFNFGDKPFKHNPPAGYQPIISAPGDRVVTNTNGSGNTAATTKIVNNAPQAIIIEVRSSINILPKKILIWFPDFQPSRELAEQTSNQIKKFKKYLSDPTIRELLVIGGVNVKEQISFLQNTGADIIVGTPGRLEDLIQGGKYYGCDEICSKTFWPI